MAASNRETTEKKEIGIDLEKIEAKLPTLAKSNILKFFGKIGAKNFKYSQLPFKDKKTEQTKYPTFYANLLVLCSYMERAKQAEIIAINLLCNRDYEATLLVARQNHKCLAIPVKIQDPHEQWVEGTASQIAGAADDFNTRAMEADEKNYGTVERLRECFPNPEVHDRQIAEWFGPGSEEATKITMAPYIDAIYATCKAVIDEKRIADDGDWLDIYRRGSLSYFSIMKENFRKSLTPNPNHVVRSGLLFSLKIFSQFFKIARETLIKYNSTFLAFGGRKADALDMIIVPALQARLQSGDLSILDTGIENVARGVIPSRLPYEVLRDTLGFLNSNYCIRPDGELIRLKDNPDAGWRFRYLMGIDVPGFFNQCITQKERSIELHKKRAEIAAQNSRRL